MADALIAYLDEKEKAKKGEKLKGARVICNEFEQKYKRENPSENIKLAHNTLLNLVKGGKTLSQFNVEKGWLTGVEEEQLITCALDYAPHGFPMNL